MQFKDLDPELKMRVTTIEAIAQRDRTEAKAHQYYLDLKHSELVCGALAKSGKPCLSPIYYRDDGSTNKRCPIHGGKSTGARTPEGKKRSLAQLRRRSPVHGLTTERLWEELTDLRRTS